MKVKQKSLWIPVAGDTHLHLRRIWKHSKGPVVFLVHGSVENGKIFYSESGKGLGPFLAEAGYDVYVADLRGRGRSRPAIDAQADYGQTEQIAEDIPALLGKIRELRPKAPQHWMGHSWGGVLLASCYARFPALRARVKSMACFATKRRIRVFNWQKLLNIDLFWNRAAPWLIKLYGYLPMKELGLGADNESAGSHRHVKEWVRPGSPWVDPEDGFDYAEALRHLTLPPTLHLVGIADRYLGNPKDVMDFIRESHPRRFVYRILSRDRGNRHDYGHADLLTHPDAREDHFPWVLSWLREGTIRPG